MDIYNLIEVVNALSALKGGRRSERERELERGSGRGRKVGGEQRQRDE